LGVGYAQSSFVVEQFAGEFFKLIWALNEVCGQVFDHEGDAWLLTTGVDVIDEVVPFMSKIVEVCAALRSGAALSLGGGN